MEPLEVRGVARGRSRWRLIASTHDLFIRKRSRRVGFRIGVIAEWRKRCAPFGVWVAAIGASRVDATHQLWCERFDSAGSNDTRETFVCYVIIVIAGSATVITIVDVVVIACAIKTIAKWLLAPQMIILIIIVTRFQVIVIAIVIVVIITNKIISLA